MVVMFVPRRDADRCGRRWDRHGRVSFVARFGVMRR
jgi:hypothetical protein